MDRIDGRCRQCGMPDHGTADCNTVDDKPIYNEAMDVIEQLKRQIEEKDREMVVCPCCIMRQQHIVDLESRLAAAEKKVRELEKKGE